MHAIEVNNVTKIYRKGFRAIKIPAVVGCTFTVGKGRITGFVGPNGAGKTTTIKMLNGLVRPSAGMLLLHGKNAAEPQSRRRVAYLSEQPYFYSHLTVAEMLRFTAQLIGVPPSEMSGEIGRTLELVGLTHKIKAKIKELSKGLQQRLNMAQALIGKPHTLILDEPMSGMDPPGRRLFRELMNGLRRQNTTLFFSTHVLDDIESVCDDVIVLQKGKVTYAGEVRALLDQGYRGTEIVANEMPEGCREPLEKAGCAVTRNDDGEGWTIVADASADVASIQRMLYEQEVYPLSIRPCTMTLEELLYRKKPEEVV
jgi:ABC-2 type transport system ATP-binding protein